MYKFFFILFFLNGYDYQFTKNQIVEQKQEKAEKAEYKLVLEKHLNPKNIKLQIYESQKRFIETTIPKKYKFILKNESNKKQDIQTVISLEDSSNNTGGCMENCIMYYFKDDTKYSINALQKKEIIVEFKKEEIEKIKKKKEGKIALFVSIFIVYEENNEKRLLHYVVDATFWENFIDKKGWIEPEYL